MFVGRCLKRRRRKDFGIAVMPGRCLDVEVRADGDSEGDGSVVPQQCAAHIMMASPETACLQAFPG